MASPANAWPPMKRIPPCGVSTAPTRVHRATHPGRPQGTERYTRSRSAISRREERRDTRAVAVLHRIAIDHRADGPASIRPLPASRPPLCHHGVPGSYLSVAFSGSGHHGMYPGGGPIPLEPPMINAVPSGMATAAPRSLQIGRFTVRLQFPERGS